MSPVGQNWPIMSELQNQFSLEQLYLHIQTCHLCPEMDREKKLRRIDAVNARSDVFIISESLAERQLRKSGVNFFQADGELGDTGRNLEKFLRKFKRTVYPPSEVSLPSGVVIPKADDGFVPVYNTESAQCFPGKVNGIKRDPTDFEIETCWKQDFLIEEIRSLEPVLLLLMGRKSRDAFFRFALEQKYPPSLTEHIRKIVESGKIPVYKIGSADIYVLPIQHASGANPSFFKMLDDEKIICLIRNVLIRGREY
jgi:uracil-DNA glycosylase